MTQISKTIEDYREEISVVERCIVSAADRLLSAEHFLEQAIKKNDEKLIIRCTKIVEDYKKTLLKFCGRRRKLENLIQEN
jgi:hypothetical protein